MHTRAWMTIWGARNVRSMIVYAKMLSGARKNLEALKHSNSTSATADELFEYVWPFCGVVAYSVKTKTVTY